MNERKSLYLAVGLWALSFVIGFLFYGLGAIINIFRWLSAYLQAISFLVWAPANLSEAPQAFLTVTQETILIWMGLTSIAAAIVTVATLVRSDTDGSTNTALGVLGITPVVPIYLIARHLRREENSSA